VAWEAVGGPGPAGVPRQGWAGAFRDPAKAGKALLVAARTGSAAWRLPGSAAAVAGAAASARAVAGPLARLRKRHPGVLDGAVLLRHTPLRRQVWRVRAAALGGPAGSRAALRIGVAGARARRADVGALRAAGVPVLVPLPVRGVAAAEAVPWWGEADLAERPCPGAARLAG